MKKTESEGEQSGEGIKGVSEIWWCCGIPCGVPLFIHHNSCGFSSPSCSLGSLSFCTPISRPPSYPFLFLSHLHRALRMCLRAMTRTIEYPTLVHSPLLFLRSALARIDSPTSRSTLFPPSLTFRSRTNVDAKEVSLNE